MLKVGIGGRVWVWSGLERELVAIGYFETPVTLANHSNRPTWL